MKNPTEFRTKDFNESAFLYASGTKFLRTEHNIVNQKLLIWFIFEDDENCNRLLQLYWSHAAMIDAKTFSEGMRTVRDLIYRTKRGEISIEDHHV